MSKYTHAKVAPAKSLKFSTIALVLATLSIGAVGAKALSTPAEKSSDTVIVSEQSSKKDCSALIAGYGCRLDAQIEAATR